MSKKKPKIPWNKYVFTDDEYAMIDNPELSNCEVARQLSVSEQTIRYRRLERGFKPTKLHVLLAEKYPDIIRNHEVVSAAKLLNTSRITIRFAKLYLFSKELA